MLYLNIENQKLVKMKFGRIDSRKRLIHILTCYSNLKLLINLNLPEFTLSIVIYIIYYNYQEIITIQMLNVNSGNIRSIMQD
jgi:hypothetical protein